MKNNRIIKNTFMLYLLTAAKIILPLVLLPFLARIFTKETYGLLNYVKAIMQYLQLFVDFGFLLSATKDIACTSKDKAKLNYIVGETVLSKLVLAFMALIFLVILIVNSKLLKDNFVFVFLSFIPVILSCFFMDFFFRGIEEMHVLTLWFVVMRGLSTLLTLYFVRSDQDLLWIPVWEIVGSTAALVLIIVEVRKRNLRLYIYNFKSILMRIKASSIYFLSDVSSTIFTIFNTILVGVYLNVVQVADWTMCLNIVSGIQMLYSPITGGIYPYMVKNKNLFLIRKILVIIMPLIFLGCVILYVFSPFILSVVGGEKYIKDADLLRAFIPLIIISFPTLLLGWPCLGAIEKQNENTYTTLIASFIQIFGLISLVYFDSFKLINIALLRGITELLLLIMRLFFVVKNRNLFNKNTYLGI